MSRRRSDLQGPFGLLALLALLAPLGLACDRGSDAAAAEGAGLGLVLLTDDPAHAGRTPEELEAAGIRPYFHDFERVQLGQVVRHVFHLRNTDPRPVTITRLQPSCACTRAELSFVDADGREVRHRSTTRGGGDVVIPAGATAELALTITTAHSEPTSHNTDKLYTVQIATDSPNRGYLRIEAHIYIERAFQATPQPLDLQRVPRNGGATGKIEIIPVGDSGARLVGVGPLPPGVRADLIAEPLYGSTLWTLEVTLEPPLEPGPILHEFELLAEDPEELPYYPFPIEIHAYAVDDVDWSPQRFIMRNAAAVDGPLEATVEVYSLLEGERLRITDARLEGEGTERLSLRVEPGVLDANGRSETWTLRLATRPPFGDAIVRGKVVVELDGHDPLQIDVMAHPR